MSLQLFAQSYDTMTGLENTVPGAGTSAGPSALMAIIWLVIAVIFIVALWKVFTKAGKPGWAAIVPIYNAYILLKIVGRPGWWLILFFIPLVNIFASLVVSADLAKKFGKSALWGIILCGILSIGYLILAFDKSKYDPNAAQSVNI